MSPRNAGKPTDAAILASPPAHSSPTTPGAELTLLQDGNASGRTPATNLHRLRPASPPRVGLSRSTDPLPFDDPCNYLG
jgi:hypothetical protein